MNDLRPGNSFVRENVRILVVEDSPTQAESLRYTLEQQGYGVSMARNGEEALDMIGKIMPTAVISDIIMPEMDGFLLCKKIKSDETLKSIPIILLTALSDPKDVLKGLECGADNFITKPYDEKYLLARLHHILINAEMRKESKTQAEVEIFFKGERYSITSERQQILDLLLSTYETAVTKNQELKEVQEKLEALNERLEKKVEERTAELKQAYDKLMEETREREQVEEQLRQAQKMEAIGTLAGGIAHDFNNILAAILGNAEIALEDTPEDGPRHNLQQILRATVRGRDLVKQILTYSRKSEKERNILRLSPLIKETFTLLRASLPTTVQMKLDLRASPDVVHADPSQIQQVIMNLITNAGYAMREKGGALEVSLDSVGIDSKDFLPERDMIPGLYLILSVKDTGCGMDESVRRRIFEPFFSTKEKGEGTGLGLSVVYGIVKGHGGGISVWSEPGQGSLFRVYVPAATMEEKSKGEGSSPGAAPRGTGRILFVDDEEAMAELGQGILTKLGYEVIATRSSVEAFTLFIQDPKRFDLVITDQTMPEMTGVALATKLLKVRPGLPIILCTGYSETVSKETAKEAGIREFVMKPASKKEMAEAVRKALARPE